MEREKNGSASPSEAELGNALQGVTRRQALSTIIGLGAAALPLTRSVLEAGQTPAPPRNLRIVTSPSSGRLLTPNDLRFAGFYRYPADAGLLYWASCGLTMRRKDGVARLFIQGDHTEGYPVIELAIPDAAPNPSLGAAPMLSTLRNWGPVPKAQIQTGGSGGFILGGLAWDETRNALWWNYGDAYVPVQHHPNVSATILNDANGTTQSYGPWRTKWVAQRTLGAFCQIPPAFASAYTGGNQIGVMAHMSSGAINSPWGASLSALVLPNPTSTPPDSTSNTHVTIDNRGIILHDADHRQSRDTRYKHEDFNVKYDCAAGVKMTAGTAEWGGPDLGAGTGDTMSACAWVDLPDKQGLLYFGQLVTTPAGYSAPGDPDGMVHMGYAALPGSPPQCCHGQTDPFFQATGPWAHYRVPMGWIYNPDDLAATAQGSAALWSRVPTSTFAWKNYVPQLNDRYNSGMFGTGAVFDRATRRIYVSIRHDGVTVPPHTRSAVLVFEVV